MRFATKAVHTGQKPDPATGATIPPVSFSTTYTQAAPGEHKGYEYSRTQNPTRENLEAVLAALEGGEACACFASGLAAETAILQTLSPGDGVVAGHDLYGGTVRLLERVYRRWGLEIAYAKSPSAADFEAAARSLARPRLVWVETPSNPLLDLTDIIAVSSVAKAAGARLVVDNTFATPYLQRPIALGADYVLHSTTKYLGGHSDVVGGAVVARTRELLEPVKFLQNAMGAVPGPLDCYLTHRGVKTLAVRMRQHCSNARAVAESLVGHPGLERLLYPGLEDHRSHALASEQMDDFGGMVTLTLRGGFDAADRFCRRLRVFAPAESLGGVESLCCHPVTMTHASIPKEIRESRGITDGLVRLSCGIEDAEDLIADVLAALGG
ncbi:MAG: PLP-dependent transferase [Candidatus Sumerlaeia bacterium]|nr:PLP-dependent transferase [Candidatus Sumerlaeia bacterium]